MESPDKFTKGRPFKMQGMWGWCDQVKNPTETKKNSHKEVEKVVKTLVATVHGIEPPQAPVKVFLGSTPTSGILLDQELVKALLDTGSPITIVSLELFLQAVAKRRTTD